MRTCIRWLLLLTLGGCGATPQLACGVHEVGSVTLEQAYGVPSIIVQANGTPLRMLLDTGGQVTAISPEAAIRAHLPVDSHIAVLRGIGGVSRRHYVRFEDATVGSVTFRPFLGAIAELGGGTSSQGTIDGMLGADALSQFDIDLALKEHRATFYEGRLCDASELPWKTEVRSLDAYRHGSDYDGRLFMPAQVNDMPLVGILDTGAAFSTMSAATAARLPPPREPVALARPPRLRGLGANVVTAHVERFGSAAIGAERFRNPEFLISDALPMDVLFGVNYAVQRRIWFSYSSGRIFVARLP